MSLFEEGSDRIRVLLVEDCPAIRTALAMLLGQDQRIEVVGTAVDGTQALELVQVLSPDVVITDLEMPNMHGADFVIHQMSRRAVPIIIFSGLDESDPLAEKALSGGAVDFLCKPARAEEVLTQQELLRRKILSASRRVQSDPGTECACGPPG